MKFITIPKETVLKELVNDSRVFLIDKYNGTVRNVANLDTITLACAIKCDENCEETQYEFYKKVVEDNARNII